LASFCDATILDAAVQDTGERDRASIVESVTIVGVSVLASVADLRRDLIAIIGQIPPRLVIVGETLAFLAAWR
jgi:hypothetical protein